MAIDVVTVQLYRNVYQVKRRGLKFEGGVDDKTFRRTKNLYPSNH